MRANRHPMYTVLLFVIFDDFAKIGIFAVKFSLQKLYCKSFVWNEPARLQFNSCLSLCDYRVHNSSAPNNWLRKFRKYFLQCGFYFLEKAHTNMDFVKNTF